MAIRAPRISGWKATIAVSMSNYIESGSIIAIATSLVFWQARFGLDDAAVGLLMAAMLFLAFTRGLGVRLPEGVLAGVV